MKRLKKQKKKDFDNAFDDGEIIIDFTKGINTQGLSKLVTLNDIKIPSWLALEIESLSKIQGNNKDTIIRQLLFYGIQSIYPKGYKVQ